ncbi:MAG: class I mannose-6-phosphate isomerase, partial [Treponema sp.]|nr:class I mannose-6-phosphate isomerase [Treponema sp.]
MLKLSAIKMDKVWGYELWIASTHPNGPQKEFCDFCGGEYPLLVKVIQADDTLSVQVHPDDETAALLEGPGNVGKTECWYVLDAKPGAKLVYGLKQDVSREALQKALEAGALEPCLNQVEVHAGDFIFIPSGTVHAIGAGLRLMEVQQSCDITYRLYDWGRPREIHVQKGLASVKNEGLAKIARFPGRFDCKYFSLEEVAVAGEWRCKNGSQDQKAGSDYSAKTNGAADQNAMKDQNAAAVQLFYVLEGSGSVDCLQGQNGAAGSQAQEFAAEDIFALA